MTLTREEMDRKMDEHFGFEARDDVEGVLATLAPNAIHDIVGWPAGPTVGRVGVGAHSLCVRLDREPPTHTRLATAIDALRRWLTAPCGLHAPGWLRLPWPLGRPRHCC